MCVCVLKGSIPPAFLPLSRVGSKLPHFALTCAISDVPNFPMTHHITMTYRITMTHHITRRSYVEGKRRYAEKILKIIDPKRKCVTTLSLLIRFLHVFFSWGCSRVLMGGAPPLKAPHKCPLLGVALNDPICADSPPLYFII